MTPSGGIANIVIPAKAGIPDLATAAPFAPWISRFRGNDTGERVIGSVLKQQALGPRQGPHASRRLM